MSTVAGSLGFRAVASWKQEQANSGGTFAVSEQGPDSNSFSLAVDAATFTEVLLGKYTILAAGTQTVNFNAFDDIFGTAVTCTKLKGVMVRATATVSGGQLKIEPGASNDLLWPLSGTTPAITLDVGSSATGAPTCCIMLVNGTTVTVSSTDANWKLSNVGSQTITVVLSAMAGA
jgi:hypothetical protein